MTGPVEIFGFAFSSMKTTNGRRAIKRADAGRRAVNRIYGFRHGGAVTGGVELRHHRNLQLRSSRSGVVGMNGTPRPNLIMKLIAFGVHFCADDDEVALVLAIFVVNQDDHVGRL